MLQDLKTNWFWRIFGSNLFLFFVLLLLLLAGWRLVRLGLRKQELNQQLVKLQQQTAMLETEKAKIAQDLNVVNSPEGIEKEARKRLNFSQPDETTVVILPEKQVQDNQSPVTQAAGGNSPTQPAWWQANLQSWQRYFEL